MRAARVGRVVAVAMAAVLSAAGPARAQDGEEDAPPRFVLDRIEIGGGASRLRAGRDGVELETELATWGMRIERSLSPVLSVGFDVGHIERTGSTVPVLGQGTTGSAYFFVDDQDIAYGGGINLSQPPGFPFVNGRARLGAEDDLHISASYAHSLPNFSGDDVEVGMGTGVLQDALIWFGASMPISRDVVTFKALGRFRPIPNLEVTATGRIGQTEGGRLEGGALSVAYRNAEPPQRWPHGTLGRLLAPESGRLQYVGAGAITGAIGGALVAGAADQRPLGDAAFKSAVYGVVVGGLLGAVFGNAMW